MGSNSVDHANLLRPYVGKWVVLTCDQTRVVASGRDLKEAMRLTPKDEVGDVVVTLVPPENAGMIL